MLRDKAVPALVRAGLNLDVYGIENCSMASKSGNHSKALASPIVVAIIDIERAVKEVWICAQPRKSLEESCFFKVKQQALKRNDR